MELNQIGPPFYQVSPQDTVIGPLLFSLYINDITDITILIQKILTQKKDFLLTTATVKSKILKTW